MNKKASEAQRAQLNQLARDQQAAQNMLKLLATAAGEVLQRDFNFSVEQSADFVTKWMAQAQANMDNVKASRNKRK